MGNSAPVVVYQLKAGEYSFCPFFINLVYVVSAC